MQNEKNNATPVPSAAVLSASSTHIKITTTNAAILARRTGSTSSVESAIADYFVSCVTDTMSPPSKR